MKKSLLMAKAKVPPSPQFGPVRLGIFVDGTNLWKRSYQHFSIGFLGWLGQALPDIPPPPPRRPPDFGLHGVHCNTSNALTQLCKALKKNERMSHATAVQWVREKAAPYRIMSHFVNENDAYTPPSGKKALPPWEQSAALLWVVEYSFIYQDTGGGGFGGYGCLFFSQHLWGFFEVADVDYLFVFFNSTRIY